VDSLRQVPRAIIGDAATTRWPSIYDFGKRTDRKTENDGFA
jgi:hypothetical protein